MNIFKSNKKKESEIKQNQSITSKSKTHQPPHHKLKENISTKTLNDGYILIAGDSILDYQAAERFRMLRAQLERQFLKSDELGVIAISSAVPSEGKSISSVNLARALANNPKGRCLIIDCDLRKPNVHRFFRLTSNPGLSDILVAGKNVENVTKEVEPGLDVIVAGSPVVDATRTIETSGFKLLINELRKKYTQVILDCPPALMCSEVLSIADNADASLLVARAWKTERQLVEEACELLKNHNLLGVVLNECSDSLSHYGYYGYYGYMGKGKSKKEAKKRTNTSKLSKLLNRS